MELLATMSGGTTCAVASSTGSGVDSAGDLTITISTVMIGQPVTIATPT